MRLKRLAVSSSLFFTLSRMAFGVQTYKIDPAWSHVEFAVKNFGLHTVYGQFKTYAGSIAFDDADITRSSVSVVVQIASIDTGIKKRDTHLQTAEFFDAVKYPDMTFQSGKIEKKGDGYVMRGVLTLKGITKEIELPFTYSLEKSADGKPILRAQAKGVINRHDFGINYGSNFSVGSLIQIMIHIQAVP